MDKSFDKILAETKKHFINSRGSHDFDHVERVLKMALLIGKKEGANLEILQLAAILHDVQRNNADKNKGKIDHAISGAEVASEILRKYKYDEKTISAVYHCIAAHRFRNDVEPKTLEAKVLFDADKLDSIGAIGVGRAFLFAGELKAKLHNSGMTDDQILVTKEFGKEDTAYREFLIKLRYIKSRMQTKEGRKLAKERHDFMVGFFKRMKKEMGGLI
ncbi:MAG: HD domain-containing protein [Candidatus Peregrinibacteria bacterium]|nr:HD domain-containing protein [Candidatus Peregrinibacteria bacterium]